MKQKKEFEILLNSYPKGIDNTGAHYLGRERLSYINHKNRRWSWYDAFVISKTFFTRKYQVELKWFCSWDKYNDENMEDADYNMISNINNMTIKSLMTAIEELENYKCIIDSRVKNKINGTRLK